MSDEIKQNDIPVTEATAPAKPASRYPNSQSRSDKDDMRKNRRTSRRGRESAPRSEFEQKILDIRRVTRVSSGGRRFSFSVAIVIGNKRGKVGVGTGKGGDTSLAIEKAAKNARKELIEVKATTTMSIPHKTSAKYCSGQVMIFPAPGRGVVAGSALRDVLEFCGLNDVNGKILSGTKNKLNIAQATIKALKSLEVPREVKKRAVKAETKVATK